MDGIEIPAMETLGLPAALLQSWMARRNGLILMTGPAGLGKSTTVAACIAWLNHHASRHVVALEDAPFDPETVEQMVGLMEIGRRDGSHTIDESIKELLAKDVITRDQAIHHCRDRRNLPEPEPEPVARKKKFW